MVCPRPKPRSNSVTYFVDKKYAQPDVIERFYSDQSRDPWADVAKLTLPGSDWNPEMECRWSDMPFDVHIVPDGTPIRYGLSRSQSKKYPKRELWYVVVGLGPQKLVDWNCDDYTSFVVDKICTMPKFMNRIGSDPDRWRVICWEAPVGIEPWYATIDDFAPDPFFVLKMDEAKKSRSWLQKTVDKVRPGYAEFQKQYQTFMRESDKTESYDCDRLDEYLRSIS